MNPCWTITDDGAFICGDLDSRVTAYSYPSSPNAEKARRLARQGIPTIKRFVVRIVAKTAKLRVGSEREAEYDARNWRRINTGQDD
jgi:hypothetical protein